eukprot:3664719-Pleurochrysis_carterae.AAC.4
MLPPSPRRGAPGLPCLPPSALPSVRPLLPAVHEIATGDGGWVKHLGRVPARWRRHRVRALSRVRAYVPVCCK